MHPDQYPERPAVRKLRLFLEDRGRAESKREDLLMVLSERGLPVTDGERARIEKCTDVEQLSLWHRRAITAASVADVLAATVPTTKPAPRPRRPRSTVKAGASR